MTWLTWPFRFAGFLLWFAWQVVLSNVAVIRDNLTPGQDSSPGIITYVTRCRTDLELTTLGALITITPGTLTLGTSPARGEDDARRLHVHGMYHADAPSLRAELAGIEDRMLHAMRRQGGPA
ncbi:Na+/H+ antiporter subunit E [Demequina pelophila]|uniref:Na+/H+ antiporter subunit E n=1 Tax=Demequina pelophila TaxID=1638984 RepID=UPI0007818CE1|nr:Na+/H+ antiporter subunit E [Demequina pelophila]